MTPGMTDQSETSEIRVKFECPSCGEHHIATRKPSKIFLSGHLACEGCVATVHEWTGFYDYLGWSAVR